MTMPGAHDRSQFAFTMLLVAAAFGLGTLGYGLYRQGQDIQNIQDRQAVETDYVCEQLSSLSLRIATRTVPIRTLLEIEAREELAHGRARRAARLRGLARSVLVPREVTCRFVKGG